MSDSTLLKAVYALITGPSQELQSQRGSTITAQDVEDAIRQGFGPIVFSEQAAEAAANETRVARVLYAAIPLRVLTLALVMDEDVAANANAKTFDIKKFANGGAIGSALATQMTTASTGFTARTKRSFTLTGGFIDLSAGDILCLDVGIANAGVQLPKFELIGTTKIL